MTSLPWKKKKDALSDANQQISLARPQSSSSLLTPEREGHSSLSRWPSYVNINVQLRAYRPEASVPASYTIVHNNKNAT